MAKRDETEEREDAPSRAHGAFIRRYVWGGNENAQGTRKRDHLRGRKAHDRGGTAVEPWSRPSENRELRTHLVCPSEWSPDQGGLRVSRLRGGRRRLRSLTTPYARVSRSSRRLCQSTRSHPHTTATVSPLATRPRSISPGVNRVQVAPRRNTHNSRHRHHRQFRATERPSPYRSATRPSISTTNKRGSEAAILSEPARCTPSRRCEIALISRPSDARASLGPSSHAYPLITRGYVFTTHQFPVRIRENVPATTETRTPYTCIRVWNNVIGRRVRGTRYGVRSIYTLIGA